MADRDLLRRIGATGGTFCCRPGRLALVVALAISACSHNDSGSKEAATTSSSTVKSTLGADQNKADASVLRLADFPAGWKEVQPPVNGRAVADCPSVVAVLSQRTGEGHSDFGSGRAAVTNTVTFWPSEAVANSYLDAWQQVINSDCAKEMLRQYTLASFNSTGVNAGSSGAEIRDINIAPLAGAAWGDRTVELRATIRVKTDQTEGDLVGDYVIVRKGRATAGFEFGDVGKPLRDPRDSLVRIVATRLADFN